MFWSSLAPVDIEIMAGKDGQGKEHRISICNPIGLRLGDYKSYFNGLGDWLLIPYMINFLMVACDTCLYFRNSKLDRNKL